MFDGYDQPKLMVEINKLFEIKCSYYGWMTVRNHQSIPTFQHSTLLQSLSAVEELPLCQGINVTSENVERNVHKMYQISTL